MALLSPERGTTFLIWKLIPTGRREFPFPRSGEYLGNIHVYGIKKWFSGAIYCCATADILMKLLQQCFLFFIVVVIIPGHNLGNSQVSVNRTIGPTLVFCSERFPLPLGA